MREAGSVLRAVDPNTGSPVGRARAAACLRTHVRSNRADGLSGTHPACSPRLRWLHLHQGGRRQVAGRLVRTPRQTASYRQVASRTTLYRIARGLGTFRITLPQGHGDHPGLGRCWDCPLYERAGKFHSGFAVHAGRSTRRRQLLRCRRLQFGGL